MRPFEARSAFTARNSRRRETRDHLMLKYVNGVRFEFTYAVGRLEMNCCNMLYYGTRTFSMVARHTAMAFQADTISNTIIVPHLVFTLTRNYGFRSRSWHSSRRNCYILRRGNATRGREIRFSCGY